MEWILDLLKEYWWIVAIVVGVIIMYVIGCIAGEGSSGEEYPSCAHGGCY